MTLILKELTNTALQNIINISNEGDKKLNDHN